MWGEKVTDCFSLLEGSRERGGRFSGLLLKHDAVLEKHRMQLIMAR